MATKAAQFDTVTARLVDAVMAGDRVGAVAALQDARGLDPAGVLVGAAVWLRQAQERHCALTWEPDREPPSWRA